MRISGTVNCAVVESGKREINVLGVHSASGEATYPTSPTKYEPLMVNRSLGRVTVFLSWIGSDWSFPFSIETKSSISVID